MKKSLATFVKLSVIMCMLSGVAQADFKEHFELGQSYMLQYQYPSAITEFKNALRINYLDNSARIGLINAYLARATEYVTKDKNYEKAANDYRSSLFYLTYYTSDEVAQNSATTIGKVQNNLEACLNAIKFDTSPENRFATAKRLRAEGEFAAAAYEFMQALGSRQLQKDSFDQIGSIMKLIGNEPKAAEFYKKATAVSPNDLSARLAYAKILDNLDKPEAALNEYSYVLSKANADNKDLLYALERVFSKKLTSQPKNANIQANMGAILQKQGRLDEALTYYKQAEALDPSNINTRINTGTLHQQKGDYRTAIKAYESVLILYPNNVNANLYRAQCYEKLGDDKIAQEGYKKVLALDPNNEYLKFQMLSNAKKTMQPEQFVTYVKTNMSSMNPAGIIYDYAIELHKENKLPEAIFMYNEAIKVDGKNAEIYINLALALAQGNNFDGALSTLEIAKNKFPQNSTIVATTKNISSMQTDDFLAKAADAYNNKNYEDAIRYYSKVSPATAGTMVGIASSYQEMGDKDKAIEFYEKALKLKPIDSDIAYYIACLYGEKEDYAKTKEYLEKAITFNKNNTQAIEYLKSIEEADKSKLLNDAIALYDASSYDESLAKFNELLSKDSQNSYAFYYRGMIYDTKEKRVEAIADLKKAYELNKDFTICNYLIASDYDALGNFKDAYNYYIAYANSDVQDDEYKQYAKARAEELKDYAK